MHGIKILYEDEDCVAFDKPAGLLVIPTLVSIVNREHKDGPHLYPAHRLDRNTSGIILFAKGQKNRDLLMKAFKERRVKKTYVALVQGTLKAVEGKICIPIKDFYQRKFQKNRPPQSALTLYRVIDYRRDYTVVEVNPVTGRTNQIRIHFVQLGHPLVGEDKYAFRKDFVLRFRRTALHAAQLSWPHPTTPTYITAKAPWPEDMRNFIEKNI